MRQRGSVIGYVLVGAVLTTLLVGGILLVKNNWRDTEQGTITVSEDRSNNTDESSEGNGQNTNKSENDKLIDSIKENEADKEKQAASADTANNSSNDRSDTSSSSMANSLPQTGTGDTVGAVFALGGLAGVSLAYYRSRSAL